MNLGFGNNIRSALAADINSTQTVITVMPGTGALFAKTLEADPTLVNPSYSNTLYSKLTLTDELETVFEVCHLVSVSGDNLTVIRGQEDTKKKGWSLNDVVSNFPTRGSENNFVQIEDLQSGKYLSAKAGGTANALTVSIPSTFYVAGGNTFALRAPLMVMPILTNTGPATVQLTASGRVVGTYPVLKGVNNPLEAGDISADNPIIILFSQALNSFFIINPAKGLYDSAKFLEKSKNLSDVMNKVAAVANLQLAGLKVTGDTSSNEGVTNTGSGISVVAIGNLSKTSGYRNIAIGNAAIAEGVNNIAIGKTANGGNSTNAVAIGADATAEHASSVALGSESKTTRTKEVSVGHSTLKRVLANLAPGELGTDAVTFDQLKQALASLADTGQLIKAGVLLPWPTNIAPPGCALAVGQAFDKIANPQLAVVYPSGFLPDMRGRTILGTPIGRAPLSLADGEVKNHGHTGEVGSTDLGSKETTSGGYFRPKVRAYRSNTALDGGDSERFSFTAHNAFADHGLVEDTPAHTHWVNLGWHGHSLRIDAYGAAKNTVDNIAFNYIVRLA